ncbi:MAG: hypothetical protein R2695_22335 [Acidimicrobiales bacterium]
MERIVARLRAELMPTLAPRLAAASTHRTPVIVPLDGDAILPGAEGGLLVSNPRLVVRRRLDAALGPPSRISESAGHVECRYVADDESWLLRAEFESREPTAEAVVLEFVPTA